MNETEFPTLQSVLREKYNINDTLFAEGRFVSLVGDHVPSLVCMGLSMKCLVIARILLNGDVMDYELLSIIPLPMLNLSYHSPDLTIKVRCQFKPIQLYQLCSSFDKDEIWDNFTNMIHYVNQLGKPSMWTPAVLKPVSIPIATQGIVPSPLAANGKAATVAIQHAEPYCLKFSESSVSLPPTLPSLVKDETSEVFSTSISCENLDEKCEHFVNDAPILKMKGVSEKLKVGVTSSDITLEVDDDESKCCAGIRKFFRRLFPCCSRKK